MTNVISIDEYRQHKVSEVICVKCGKRWLAVPPSHPFYLLDYDTVNETIEIHGGLTFAAPMEKIMEFWPKEDTECIGFDSMDEIPKDYWVFGFDTLHAFDGPHLDRQWCIDETKNLMKQLETQKGEAK